MALIRDKGNKMNINNGACKAPKKTQVIFQILSVVGQGVSITTDEEQVLMLLSVSYIIT